MLVSLVDKERQKWLHLTMASAKRNEVMKFGEPNSDCTLAADGFTVGGGHNGPPG